MAVIDKKLVPQIVPHLDLVILQYPPNPSGYKTEEWQSG